MSGCAVHLSIYDLKVGMIDEVTIVENGSRVTHEDVVGIKIQWLPRFSWADVKSIFSRDKDEKSTE